MSDHCPLRHFMTQPNLSPRQVRWQEYLSRFAFDWVYTPGKTNPADALSRRADFKSLSMITRSRTGSLPKQHVDPVPADKSPSAKASRQKKPCAKGNKSKAQQTSTEAAPTADDTTDLLARIKAGYKLDSNFEQPAYTNKWTFTDGLWYKSPPATATETDPAQIVVPAVPALRKLLLSEHHDTRLAGHGGVTRTSQSLLRQYWWPKVHVDVRPYIRTCPACQQNKASNQKPAGLLQPLPIPHRKWESIGMDFIVQLPCSTAGHDSILVVIDRLSKLVHLIPTTTDVTALGVANLFIKEVVRHHGMPNSIVSDRDSKFTSNFWQHASDDFHRYKPQDVHVVSPTN